MDFKKQNRPDKERQRISVPQRRHLQQTDSQHAHTESPASKPEQTTTLVSATNSHRSSRTPRTPVTRIRHLLLTKKAIVASIVVVAVVGSIAVNAVIKQRTDLENAKKNDPNALIENLEYQTVIPDGKSIGELGGWKRVSPAKSDPVFAYNDTLDGVAINVSQQPLPKSFKGGDQIADLAKRFNATTKIDANGTTVYVGTSAKGPQSAILSKNDLLILIKSQNKIDDKSWAKYARSLN